MALSTQFGPFCKILDIPWLSRRHASLARTMTRKSGGDRNRTAAVHWALIPLLAGVVIGVAFSTVFLLQPYTAVTNIYLELPSSPEVATTRFGDSRDLQRPLSGLGAARGTADGAESPAKLADEADAKDPVYYAVVMSQRHSAEQLKVLRDTWARDVPHQRVGFYVRSEERDGEGLTNEEVEDRHYGEIDSSEAVVELASTDSDLFMEVVSHVCRNRLNLTKWYLLARDDVYIKSSELESHLQRYENMAAHSYLGRRANGDSARGECGEGSGVILSRSVLSGLCQQLRSCGEEGENVGGCLTKKLGLSCNQLDSEGVQRFLLIDSDIKGSITEKSNAASLNSALSLHPIPDSKMMYGVHQAVVGSQLNSTQHQIHSLKWALDRMTELLPPSGHTLHSTHRQGAEVISIDDVVSWKLVNHDGLLSDEEFSPTRAIPGVWREELDDMMEKAVQYVSTKEDTPHVYKRMINAYWRVDPLSAIHYIIDFETSRPDTSDDKPRPSRYRITFTRPLNPPEISHTLPPVGGQVTIVVCFTSELTESLQRFLGRLEAVLDRGQRVGLVAVQMRSASEKQKPRRTQSTVDAKSLLSLYRSKYQSASFTLLESPALLSRSHAISVVLRESRPSELLFLADLDLQFGEGFLEKCRSLPLQGQQVYFPIVFSLRDPALLASLNHSLIEGAVSQHSGHWLVWSYSVACVFAGDLLALSSQSELKGMLNEVDMEEVYETLLGRGYEVVRAPDRQLKRIHNPGRLCDLDLVGLSVGDSCKISAGSDEPRYLQTQLSALLFDHEGENSANKY